MSKKPIYLTATELVNEFEVIFAGLQAIAIDEGFDDEVLCQHAQSLWTEIKARLTSSVSVVR